MSGPVYGEGKVEWVEGLEVQFGDSFEPPPGTRREVHEVEESSRDETGWTITVKDGFTFGVSDEKLSWDRCEDFKPKAGDEIVLWSYGTRVLGVEHDGKRLYRLSEREHNLDWALIRARMTRTREEEFIQNKGRLDAEYEALPDIFKARIDRFRENNPDFRKEYETYEMFCCTEAVKIAEAAKAAVESGENMGEVDEFWEKGREERERTAEGEDPPREVRWLFWAHTLNSETYDYDYERQKAVTGLDDGHSGNTAGAAFMLARLYLESPEYVQRMHGALSPLVGSKAYGDIPPEGGAG